MVSKIEILEYLLIHGETKYVELWKIFKGCNWAVNSLIKSGLVKKYIKVYTKTPLGDITVDEKIIDRKTKLKGKCFIDLNEGAYRYLRTVGVNSFYDTPMAKRYRYLLSNKRDFIDVRNL